MGINKANYLLFVVLLLVGCGDDTPKCIDSEMLVAGFEFLPENQIAIDEVSGITARYINPVTRYTHGVLGDAIEAGALLVTQCDQKFIFNLDTLYVFEDIQPRLFDMTNDGVPEVITILTSVSLGASVGVFEIGNDSLYLKAQSEYIGRNNRWLNIAAINDLDNDGNVEIVWVSTPHIGGILNVAHIEGSIIKVLDIYEGVSNHKIGSSNLDLSFIIEREEQKTLYLPNNEFDAVIGFQFKNNQLYKVDSVAIIVDPHVPLREQFYLK